MLARLLKILIAIPLAYLIAGALGGAVPLNAGWREPDDGITIWVATNGVHTGLLLPTVGGGVDWRSLVKASDLADPRYAGPWLWFGWGERDFYLHTPRWSDVSPRTVLRSMIGSDRTLLHVDHVFDPATELDARPVRLTPTQYARLAAAIRARFALGADGRPKALRGYGPADVFYEAHGHYDAIRTCNWWTGHLLAEAGVRVGAWTPFSPTVMEWF